MKKKVIILGHNALSRLSVARALGKDGYYVIVVAPKQKAQLYKPLDKYSKYVNEFHYCLYQEKALFDYLTHTFHKESQKIVLFPTSDFTVSVISLFSDKLNNDFCFPHINNKKDTIIEWMNKNKQKQLAADVGLNVAKGCIVVIKNGDYTLPEEIQFPCFIKPLQSINGGKKWLKRCDCKEELLKTLDSIISFEKDIQILVEDFISITHEYAVVGYAHENGAILPGLIEIQQLAGAGHFGVAKKGIICSPSTISDLLDTFSAFITKTGYIGIFDIDFFESNGKYYFGELNLRYGGSTEAYIRNGINLPAIMANHLGQGILPQVVPNIKEASTFANEITCLDDWYYDVTTFEEYNNILHSADFKFIEDDEDPLPFTKGYRKLIKEKWIKKIIKKIVRWGK